MIILIFFIVPIFYMLTKFILYFIVNKFGKFSYDGFSAAGFSYNSKKDAFYSVSNAWQRKLGYCHLYDVSAPFLRMIIDTEPIRFYYNNKNWLITFWKGQYGITTGAEIGIYNTTLPKVNKKTLYLPASDEEMLDMAFILYKNGEEITRISNKHWWLAIFKIGMFSKPKELSMDIKIEFPNKEMLEAFLSGFKKLGYKPKHYRVNGNTFYFTYIKPRTHKVWSRSWISDSIRQHYNRKNVKLYNKYLSDVVDDNGIDDSNVSDNKVILLNKLIPELLKNNVLDDKKIKSSHSVIFLTDSVYSNLERDNNEQKTK